MNLIERGKNMFLKQTLKDNKKLVDYSIKLHKEGKILPDTYVIDMDMLIQNASKIYEKPTNMELSCIK